MRYPRRSRVVIWLLSALCCAISSRLTAAAEIEWSRQVLLPDGSPAVGAAVQIESIRTGSDGKTLYTTPLQRLVTDGSGKIRARMDLPNGASNRLRVIVDAPGAALTFSYFSTHTWTGRIDLDPLRLTPPYLLSGTVRDPEGRPVPDVRVTVTSIYAPYTAGVFFNAPHAPGATPHLMTRSGADGQFTLRGFEIENLLNRAHAELRVSAIGIKDGVLIAGMARKPVLAQNTAALVGPPVEVVVRRAMPIRGRVVDAADGKPIAGATLSVLGFSTRPDATTDAEGRFEVDAVPPYERLAVHAAAPGFLTMAARAAATERLDTVAAVDDLQFALRPLANVSGTVRDSLSGKAPLFPLGLVAHVEERLANGWVLEGAYSGDGNGNHVRPDGGFAGRLPVGRITLAIDGPDSVSRKPYDERITIEIPREGNTDLRLTVARRPGVLIRMPSFLSVKDAAGERQLVVEVAPVGADFVQYAEDRPVWFYPVERWGDRVRIRVELRGGSSTAQLLPWTEYTADPALWPTDLRLGK